MNRKKADLLIVKLLEKRISEGEAESLTKWLEEDGNVGYFNKFIEINHFINSKQAFDYRKSLNQIKLRIKERRRSRRRSSLLIYAAAIAILLSIGYFMVPSEQVSSRNPIIVNSDIKAGSEKATLTLQDGSEVILQKGKTYATKNIQSTGEKLLYDNASEAPASEITYNYLTIPRGGQFFVQLSDGTKVWLNSESKLKYPVNFVDGKPRVVELVYGEAYFDVSPGSEHQDATFKVFTGEQEIEVLGTEFNIKSYQDDDNTYTTLVEGKIILNVQGTNTVLKPNQRANVDNISKHISIDHVDVYNDIAWKEGVFSFEGKSLNEIMKVFSRWYDIDIEFKNEELKKKKFDGIFSKKQNIESILESIQKTKEANFKVEGKKIILKN